MALAHVQDMSGGAYITNGSGHTCVMTIGDSVAVTAGNAIVVAVMQVASITRTYTVQDSYDSDPNQYVQLAAFASPTNYRVELWGRPNHPAGGNLTVTVTQSSTAANFRTSCAEFSGFGSTFGSVTSDSLEESAVGNDHTASTSGVTSGSEVIAFVVGLLISSATECSPGTGYAESPSGAASVNLLYEWKRFATGCTNEVGAWSSSGTQRKGVSLIALVPAASAGGSTVPVKMNSYRRRHAS